MTERLRRWNEVLVSERGAAVVKGLLVGSLCLLMVVAVIDARAGRLGGGPAPAAFAAAPR